MVHQKQFMIHVDGCSIDTNRISKSWLEEHGMQRMPHHPFSPDWATGEFY
jgi:hypothetical protein